MIRIVQFTDTHMDADPALRAVREADLANHIAAINALKQQPDLVLHTGDISNGGRPAEYDIVLEHMRKLRSRWVMVPGNRDSRRRLHAAFSSLGWLPQHAEGALDFAVEVGPLTLIGYDSKGPGTNKGWATPERLVALRQKLEAADGRPVIVAMHHPPFELHEIPWPRQFEDWGQAEALQALIAEFPNVRLLACGHAHRHIAGEVGGAPAWTMLCCASDLRKGPAKELGADVALKIYDFDDAGNLLSAEMQVFPVAEESAPRQAPAPAAE